MKSGFDDVFLAFGANVSLFMGIPGEDLCGVYGANELLQKGNHPDYKDKRVAVIGGGNVAMDAARTVNLFLPKEVTVIYRRSEAEMPAAKKEIEECKEDGIAFLFQTNVIKILGQEKVEKVECVQTKLMQKEGDARLTPVNIENSNFYLEFDYVLMAIGSKTEEKVVNELGLEVDKRGYIRVDEQYKTSKPHVFAGGDLVGTKSTVSMASRTGIEAAKQILKDR